MNRFLLVLACLALSSTACGGGSPPATDGGAPDASPADAAPDGANFDAGLPPPPPPSDVAGTLRFVGCDPDPRDIIVHLAPVQPALASTEPASIIAAAPLPSEEAPAGELLRATVERTAEAGVVTFRVLELPYGPYQLAVHVEDPTCGELAWRGPTRGVLIPGDEEVTLDALALRTRLQVNAGTDAAPRWVSADWVGPDTIERTFRVRTDLEGVVAFDLQLSFDRFEVDALSVDDFCSPPEGAPPVARFESPPGGREVDLDISGLFAEPGAGATPVEVQRFERLLRGAPVYVRAVPVGADGPLCNLREVGASTWVRFVWQPQLEVAPVVIDTPPYHVVGSYEPGWNPTPAIITQDRRCMRVIADHRLPGGGWADGLDDFYGKIMVLMGWFAPGGTVPAGFRFCLAPPSSDNGNFLDDLASGFSDLVGDVVDAVEWAVNRAAAVYEAIKSSVINLVANAVADLTGCEDPCRAALELGMEIALTSMGLPPSLPDFDQLMDQGLDYVAAELAAQAGVPDFVAEQALDLAIEMAERAKVTRGLPSARWLVSDSGGRSSLFVLEVSRNPSGASTTSEALWFRPLTPDQVWVPRYIATHVPPVGAPPLRVPVLVEPVLDGLPAVEPLIPDVPPLLVAYYGSGQRVEAWYQYQWGQRLASHHCARFELWRAISVRAPVPIEPVAAVNISHDAAYDGFATPFEEQCSL